MLALSLIVIGVDAGCAQDIAGIEDCTKTSGLDKRTGCLALFSKLGFAGLVLIALGTFLQIVGT